MDHTDTSPMSQMNTTPLIDVMLVLLIMFIITIPVATHSVDIDLPIACTDCPDFDLSPVKNKIVVDAQDRVLWNGTVVSDPQLAAILVETTRMKIEPELQFEPEARASYAASARTLRTIKTAKVSKFGFVGNEKYRTFSASQ